MPRNSRSHDNPRPSGRSRPLRSLEDDEVCDEPVVSGELIPFVLPSGHEVVCQNEAEVTLCELTAKPYLDLRESVSEENWIHVKGYLENVLIMDRVNREITKPTFPRLAVDKQREIRSLKTAAQQAIERFATKLDEIRGARDAAGQSPVELRRWLMDTALKYAEENLGEFSWQARCPDPECKHHDQPFMMLMEVPHFAFDPAAGPGAVWNGEIADLVHLHYCRGVRAEAFEDAGQPCSHPAHEGGYETSLSVRDAARILRTSPLKILMTAWEREFDLGFFYDPDVIATLRPYAD